jgi:hypothetical protein
MRKRQKMLLSLLLYSFAAMYAYNIAISMSFPFVMERKKFTADACNVFKYFVHVCKHSTKYRICLFYTRKEVKKYDHTIDRLCRFGNIDKT